MNQNLRVNKQTLRDKKHGENPFVLHVSFLLLICLLIIVFAGCASTKNNGDGTLQAKSPAVITGIAIQDNMITITADKPFLYTLYKPGDPYKLVLDMPDTSIGAFTAKIVSSKTGITEIIPSQIESPSLLSKLEILLQTPGSVEQEYSNNTLILKIREDAAKLEAPRPVMQERKTEEQAPAPVAQSMRDPLPKATEITEISFEPSADVVKVFIKGNGSMVPNVFPLEDRIVIDIPDVALNAMIPLSVVSPVKGLRSGRHDEKVRLVLDLQEKTNFDVASVADSIVISLRRNAMETTGTPPAVTLPEETVSPASEPVRHPEKLAGTRCEAYIMGQETVNFDFQDQDIVPILRLFADISGCNLFIHPDVKGKATMKFRDVPWDQALDTILKTFSLDKDIQGNIIRIAPNRVFTQESEERLKADKARQVSELATAPLERKTYRLVYANAEDVKQKLLGQTLGSTYDEETKVTRYEYAYDEKQRILTSRGNATAERVSNVVVVNDLPSKIIEVDDFIKEIDQPTRQVMIEARIVEVNTNKQHELGIQWGINFKGSNTLMSAGGLSGVPATSAGAVTGGNYIVDFPSTSVGPLSGSGITFGIMDPSRTIGLDMQLSALESVGTAKVITNPKVMTMDRQQARIMQGKSIPVRKLTTEGTVSTEFKDVAMELIVTPSITREQTLDLDVVITKEELDPTVPSVEGVPGTDKKEALTKVRVQDGETLVIGGLYKINTSDTETGVPILMNIPGLGWLFKRKAESSTTTELIIFVTPRIIITERPQ